MNMYDDMNKFKDCEETGHQPITVYEGDEKIQCGWYCPDCDTLNVVEVKE